MIIIRFWNRDGSVILGHYTAHAVPTKGDLVVLPGDEKGTSHLVLVAQWTFGDYAYVDLYLAD